MNLIEKNLREITNRINALNPGVRLVAVSKTKPVSEIMEAFNLGHRHFGENYVQELVSKATELPSDIKWHFIGTLQSNKIKAITSIPNLYLIETVDSLKKAQMIDKECQGRNEKIKIYVQVNTSGEDSKSGVEPTQVPKLCKDIIYSCENVKFAGLMTIGSREGSALGINPDFECLVGCKKLVEQETGLNDLELSMGMSDDFESAIKQGSTSVRVGSKIFGARSYA